MTESDSLVSDIRAMIDRFLEDTMRDPDMVAASEDFRAGYRRGFSEAVAACTAPRVAAVQRAEQAGK